MVDLALDTTAPRTQATLDDFVAGIQERVDVLPNAQVSALDPNTVRITADVADPAMVTDLLIVPPLSIRPVLVDPAYPSTTPTAPTLGADQSPSRQPSAATDTPTWLAEATSQVAMLRCPGSSAPFAEDPTLPLIACDDAGRAIFILDTPLIVGTDLESATTQADPSGSGWTVLLTFGAAGFSTWSSWTASNIGETVALVDSGTVLLSPRVAGPVTSPQTQIAGNMTQKDAEDLVAKIRRGILPMSFAVTQTAVLN